MVLRLTALIHPGGAASSWLEFKTNDTVMPAGMSREVWQTPLGVLRPSEHCKAKDVEVESNFTEAVWFNAEPPSDFSGREPPRKGGRAQDFFTFGI